MAEKDLKLRKTDKLVMMSKHANHWNGWGWKQGANLPIKKSPFLVLMVENAQIKVIEFVHTSPVPLESTCALFVGFHIWQTWTMKDCKMELIQHFHSKNADSFSDIFVALYA